MKAEIQRLGKTKLYSVQILPIRKTIYTGYKSDAIAVCTEFNAALSAHVASQQSEEVEQLKAEIAELKKQVEERESEYEKKSARVIQLEVANRELNERIKELEGK